MREYIMPESSVQRLARGLAVAAGLKREAVGRTYRNEALLRLAVAAIRNRREGADVKEADDAENAEVQV